MNVANEELVETWRRYDAAPGTPFHVSVGFFDTPAMPFGGVSRIGAPGPTGPVGVPAVLKFQTTE
jgi:hypothetical protein